MPDHIGYTREQLDAGRNLVDAQLSAFSALVDAVESEAPDGTIETTVSDIESGYFATLALALDRVLGTGSHPAAKDEPAIAEFTTLVAALLSNGPTTRLTADQFERLTDAVFAELDKKLSH